MEPEEIDRVKSLEMLRELQTEHKSIKNNPELHEIQKKIDRHRKKEENLRYKSPVDHDFQDLRQRFQNALNKLNSIDTRELALKEAKSLIERNNSIELLKIYISSLSEHRKSKSTSARELEVQLLGYLSEVYKENLIEEAAPLRVLLRIAEIIQTYFKDLNRRVHEAAAQALCSLYKFALPKSSQDIIFSFMFDPLASILTSGSDVQVQQASALTIYTWTLYLIEDKDQGNLLVLYSKTLNLFLKLRADYVDLVNTLGLISTTCGFEIIMENLAQFLIKIGVYLKHPSANSQLIKITTCKLINCLGKHLMETQFKISPFPLEILNTLKELRTEKLPVVQSAARETLKTWEIYQGILLDQPVQVSPIVTSPKANKKPESHFQAIRNLVKLQKEKSKPAENAQENLWGLAKAGFLKKGTGNYMVVPSQGHINIAKALEKRPSAVEYLKKQHPNSNNGKIGIFYKKNSQILEYERDPSPKFFEVQKEIATCSTNKFLQDQREKIEKCREEVVKINEGIENIEEEEEKSEEFKGFVRMNTESTAIAMQPAWQNNRKSADYLMVQKVNGEKQNETALDHENSPKLERKSESVTIINPDYKDLIENPIENSLSVLKIEQPEKNNIKEGMNMKIKIEAEEVEENAEEFQGFIRMNSESTSLGIEPVWKLNRKNEENLVVDKKSEEKKVEAALDSERISKAKRKLASISNNPEDKELVQIKNEKLRSNNNFLEKKSESLSGIKPAIENPQEHITVINPVYPIKESYVKAQDEIPSQLNEKALNLQPPKYSNRVQVMVSQNIEIKPLQNIIKKRSNPIPIKNCKIEQQEAFRIYKQKSQVKVHENTLKLQHLEHLNFKGINSKMIQTSIDSPDTPRFSKDFKSHIYEVQEPSIDEGCFEIIQVQAENIMMDFEKSFEAISQEMEKVEERLDWACETCECLKKFRKIKKNLQKKIQPVGKKKSANSSTQCEPELKKRDFVLEKKKKTQDYLTNIWTSVLELLDNNELIKAYEQILLTGDDIYLLRTMSKTEPCLDKLPIKVSQKVLQKIIAILQSRFIENLGIEWLINAFQLDLFHCLPQEDIYLLLDSLQNIAVKGGDEGLEAFQLCNAIVKELE